MSAKEANEFRETRRRNLMVYDEVKKLRQTLEQQIKIDSGKLSLIIARPSNGLETKNIFVKHEEAQQA